VADEHAAIGDVLRALAPDWRLVGRLAGGRQSGAWHVQGSDGTAGALKIATSSDWAGRLHAAARSVATVRAAGYPTPAWLEVGTTDAGVGYVVQEFCSGHPVQDVDVDTAAAVLAVIEAQAGLDPDPGRCWSDFLAEQVGDGYAELRSAAAVAGADGRLLGVCDRLVASSDRVVWPRTDMVHGDLRPANLLLDDGAARGVVDIEAIGSGPRTFDHATLLSHGRIAPAAVERIVAAGVAASDAHVLRACVAFVFLDLVRFSGRHPDESGAERVDRVRVLGERAETVERLTR
jgi:aminoglycoside phosphotransferase (APT) family kinase protein